MRCQILVLLCAFACFALLAQTVMAYSSCNGFMLNTTSLNSQQIRGICHWQGGDLYLTWSHGQGSGFVWYLQTYNNSNATLYTNGGGTDFNYSSPCSFDLGSKYYPQGDYLLEIQAQGISVNGSCYSGSLRLGTSPPMPSTSTSTRYTTAITTTYTTSIYNGPPTTTLNISVSPSTPLLALSSNSIYTNGSVTVISRPVSSSDVVDILVNGQIMASGLGQVSYNMSGLAAGSYSIQAYDVNQRLYSQELTLSVLPTTTTSTTSIRTTIPTIVTTVATSSTSIEANQTNTTKGNTAQQPNILQQIWNAIVNFFSHL